MMTLMRHGFLSTLFLGFLVLAGFSLVLTDWSGSFRSGVNRHDVAKINGHKITQNEFARLVERTLRAEHIRPEQAYQMGLINQILTTEMWQRMLSQAGYSYGLAISDSVLLKKLEDLAAPIAAQEKSTAATVIKRFIESQGLSEGDFLESMRREIANNLLRDVIAKNSNPNPFMVNDLIADQQQTRQIDYAIFPDSDVSGITPPDTKALTEYYNERKAEFMLPERRNIRLALLKRDSLAKMITITESDARTFYDEHQDRMKSPARHHVTTLTYKTKEEANRLISVLKPGDDLTKIAQETLKPAQTATQDFLDDSTLPEVMKPVMAAKVGETIGPLETPFGWLVARVDDITPAGQKTFDQAKSEITDTLRDEKMGTLIDSHLEALDQAHESGGSFDELVKSNHMTVQSFKQIARDGTTSDAQDAFKEWGALKAPVLTTAFSTSELGRVSAPIEFKNGDVGILVVDEIIPTKAKDLETVREQLIQDWMAMTRKRTNVMAMQAVLPDLIAGKVSMAEIANKKGAQIITLNQAARASQNIPTSMDPAAWTRLFEAEVGQPIFQTLPTGVMLAVIKSANLPAIDQIKTTEQETVRSEIKREIEQEQITQYLGALNDRYNAKVNEKLLRQMYAPKVTSDQ